MNIIIIILAKYINLIIAINYLILLFVCWVCACVRLCASMLVKAFRKRSNKNVNKKKVYFKSFNLYENYIYFYSLMSFMKLCNDTFIHLNIIESSEILYFRKVSVNGRSEEL